MCPTMSKHWQPPMSAKEQVEALRKRDGGKCWLCDKPIDFTAEPNSDRAPTREHLVPECQNGPSTPHNLVLCHPPCNRKLGDLPVAEKVRMRDQFREEAWKAAMRKQLGKLLVP